MTDAMNHSSGPGPDPGLDPTAAPPSPEPTPTVTSSPEPTAPPPDLQPAPSWTPSPEASPAWTPIAEPVTASSAAPTATAAIAPVDVTPRPRSSRTRWAIAGVIALLIVAISAAGLFALVGASSNSAVAAWAPSDSLVYLEIRGDLPGDQRQNLGSFLAHFPGFADQSNIDAKLDEALDRLVGKATNDKHDWTKEIKPWFGGQVGLSASGTFASGTAVDPKNVHELLVASQKDPNAAIAWLKSVATEPTTEETYQGVTLTVSGVKSVVPTAAVATNGVLLVGDEPSVKAAIDRGGKDGLAASPNFKTGMAALSGDQLVRVYVDTKTYFDAIKTMAGSAGLGQTLDAAELAKVPAWMTSGTRLESDAIAGELALPLAAGITRATAHESAIARHLPSSTLALVEEHDLGKVLLAAIPELKKQPAIATSLDQIEQATKLIGGLDGAIEWIGDVGVVVTSDGTTPGGGLVVVPSDQKKADDFATRIKTVLSLAGVSGKVTVTDEPYGAGTITTVDLGDASQLMGGATGGSAGMNITGDVQISFTDQGGLVIIGGGPAWVKSIVDVKPGSSLADQARYRDAMARVGTSNTSSMFFDLTAIRTLAEPLIKQIPDSKYATDVKPYLAPFDVLAVATSTKDDTAMLKSILTVIKPQ